MQLSTVRVLSVKLQIEPMLFNILHDEYTSDNLGQFNRVVVPSHNRVLANIGKELFFEP